MRLALIAVLGAMTLHAQPDSMEWLKGVGDAVRRNGAAATRSEIERCLEAAGDDPRRQAYAHAALALLAEMAGQTEAGDREFAGATAAAAKAQDAQFSGQAALIIGQERLRSQNSARAGVWGQIAAADFRTRHDLRRLALALHLMARAGGPGAQRNALLQEALAAARDGGDTRDLATIQIDWGDALRLMGEFANAIDLLKATAQKLEDMGVLNEAGRALSALGRTYLTHGLERESMAALERSKALLEKAGDVPGAMGTLQTIGVVQSLTGHHNEALRSLDTVRHYAEDPSAPVNTRLRLSGVAYGYLMIGEYATAVDLVEHVRKNFPQRAPPASYWISSRAYFALGRYQESIDVAAAGLDRVPADQAFSRLWMYRWRARSLDKLGRLEEAAHDMLEAVRMANTIRGNLVPEDEFRRAHGNAQEDFADDAIEVLWRAGRKQEAFHTAEQFRARAFLDLMASRAPAGERPAFSDPPSPDALSALAMRRREPILSYWVHPQGVYLWLVDATGRIHSARAALAETRLNRLVERARGFSYTPDRDAWRELYRILIQPVEAWLPAKSDTLLTLLPHGALLQLPFAALIDPGSRYLAERYTLRVLPAAGMLAQEKRPAAPGGSYVLIGAPRDTGMAILPGAQRELEKVAALLPGATMLSGAAAQARQVRAAADGARVLHFATHALVEDSRPFASFLALSGKQKLTAAEIYTLRLRADLVVLSACRSGSGRISADGLLGFTRAFLYAGASSVVAPLWDIPDEPTVWLVEEFYRRYRSGASKSQALREAQLKLLAELKSGKFTISTPAGPMALPEHPALWAGFIIQGGE